MSFIKNIFSYNNTALSGAMDMIAVKQPDDTFKASSIKAKFGYLKILNAKEKKVIVKVNGKETPLYLRLSESGEVYYPEEVKKYVKKSERLKHHLSDPNESEGYLSAAENLSAYSHPQTPNKEMRNSLKEEIIEVDKLKEVSKPDEKKDNSGINDNNHGNYNNTETSALSITDVNNNKENTIKDTSIDIEELNKLEQLKSKEVSGKIRGSIKHLHFKDDNEEEKVEKFSLKRNANNNQFSIGDLPKMEVKTPTYRLENKKIITYDLRKESEAAEYEKELENELNNFSCFCDNNNKKEVIKHDSSKEDVLEVIDTNVNDDVKADDLADAKDSNTSTICDNCINKEKLSKSYSEYNINKNNNNINNINSINNKLDSIITVNHPSKIINKDFQEEVYSDIHTKLNKEDKKEMLNKHIKQDRKNSGMMIIDDLHWNASYNNNNNNNNNNNASKDLIENIDNHNKSYLNESFSDILSSQHNHKNTHDEKDFKSESYIPKESIDTTHNENNKSHKLSNQPANEDTKINIMNEQENIDVEQLQDKKKKEEEPETNTLSVINKERKSIITSIPSIPINITNTEISNSQFQIVNNQSITIPNTTPKLSLELSNCWYNAQTSKSIEDEFYSHMISEKEFLKDPWTVINNKNLAIKFNDCVYNWKAIAPVILSYMVFGKPLKQDTLDKLTETEKGFLNKLFGSTKIKNSNVIKIDSTNNKNISPRKISTDLGVSYYINGNASNAKSNTNVVNLNKSNTINPINNEDKNISKQLSSHNNENKKDILDNNELNKAYNSFNADVLHSSKINNSNSNNKSNLTINTTDTENEKELKLFYKRNFTLTSDQLKLLKLNYGKNDISFTVYSRFQGEQTLSFCIYLWDYSDKIIISDVDGTITRSDFLGHVLPLLGRDWTHKGIVSFFNNIYSQGYKILYLTARALGQSDSTKRYLTSLIQENQHLPEGPVLMSPDALTLSFKREVIDRTPQNFKIACLYEILGLFPDEESPFFAGFGNRITDNFSYMQVGVDVNRIFMINEKGQITQRNKHVHTSYSNLNELLDLIFPYSHGVNNMNNTKFGFFKPRVKNNIDVKALFE